jgi:exonuclease VII large subunit
VLQRGYAVIRAEDGSSIRSTRQVAKGQQLKIEVTDGTFGAQVNATAVNH